MTGRLPPPDVEAFTRRELFDAAEDISPSMVLTIAAILRRAREHRSGRPRRPERVPRPSDR